MFNLCHQYFQNQILLITCGTLNGVGSEIVLKFLATIAGFHNFYNKKNKLSSKTVSQLKVYVANVQNYFKINTKKNTLDHSKKLSAFHVCLIGDLKVLEWHAKTFGLKLCYKQLDNQEEQLKFLKIENSNDDALYELTGVSVHGIERTFAKLKISLYHTPVNYQKLGLRSFANFIDLVLKKNNSSIDSNKIKSNINLKRNTIKSLYKDILLTIGEHSYRLLTVSKHFLECRLAWGVVNAPVSKKEITLYLRNLKRNNRKLSVNQNTFSGQTEFYASVFKTKKYSMVFFSPFFNLVLLTTHIPLSEVASNINKKNIYRVIEHAYEIKQTTNNKNKILLLGINPHAGEGGTIGNEDTKIKRIIAGHKYSKYIDGPISADTAFMGILEKKYGVVISCYHDQGLIPLKLLPENFFHSVNVTWGLPFVRVSVDHGTAVDIVGKNLSNPSSFFAAIDQAINIRSKTNIVSRTIT